MDPQPQSVWSSIVKKPPPPPQHPPSQQPTTGRQLPPLKSSDGISTAVVDANAVIEGGERINGLADRFVTVPEVLLEIRDPVSRHRLSLIPFSIDPVDPTPDALAKVVKFARATGDLHTLSDVDIKLIALTYMLEAQAHGTSHLRGAPPPVHTVQVKRLPEKEMPGWGNNVPNLEEWEALEREEEEEEHGGVNGGGSRILPVKDISLDVVEGSEEIRGDENDGSVAGEEGFEDVDNVGGRNNRRYPLGKREVKIKGKTVVEGVDASKGEFSDDAGDWLPAVSRSTHRRFLRRKARRGQYEAQVEKDSENGDNVTEVTDVVNGDHSEDDAVACSESDISIVLEQMRLEESTLRAVQEGACDKTFHAELGVEEACVSVETGATNGKLEHVEIASETDGSLDTSNLDDDAGDGNSNERSRMLRSLSESSVACVTSDFAMQNVLLQMGLRLLAPGGNQIRQLHRWVLKCHACFTVTTDIGRIFCPKCGNGGTLRKVAVTVGENGVVLAARKPRITLRGTKFSLPLPKGGRDAITKNPILREDQLPQKFLHPKTKKKANKEGDEFFAMDTVFNQHNTDKNGPFQPPVRKAIAVFGGRRNPNDNHYSRARG